MNFLEKGEGEVQGSKGWVRTIILNALFVVVMGKLASMFICTSYFMNDVTITAVKSEILRANFDLSGLNKLCCLVSTHKKYDKLKPPWLPLCPKILNSHNWLLPVSLVKLVLEVVCMEFIYRAQSHSSPFI